MHPTAIPSAIAAQIQRHVPSSKVTLSLIVQGADDAYTLIDCFGLESTALPRKLLSICLTDKVD